MSGFDHDAWYDHGWYNRAYSGFGPVGAPVISPPRNLKVAAYAQETEEAIIVLLTVSHPQLIGGSMKFARNPVDIVSRGETYLAYAFEVPWPWQDSERQPTVTLRIDNVDRKIVETLRLIDGPPTIKLEYVMASALDVVEGTADQLTLRNASYDINAVEGDLVAFEVLGRRFPKGQFSPSSHPGIF